MNPLEALLRSWTPRRPSPGLERRWQHRQAHHVPLSRLLTVLAPTAACLLLTVSMVIQSGHVLLPDNGDRAAMVTAGLSNQNFAAYLTSSFQPTANRLDTFEWTNRGYSKSSMRSLPSPTAIDLQ